MTEAELFKECREALGYSVRGMADALLVGDRSVFRWEADTLDVSGPAWVIISYMLEERADEQPNLAKRLYKLADQVDEVMDSIQYANKQKRLVHNKARQEHKIQREKSAG